MSNSLSVCPECHDEWADDCFDEELGICRMCIREMKRKADAYPVLVEALKRHVSLIPDLETYYLLKELGELK